MNRAARRHQPRGLGLATGKHPAVGEMLAAAVQHHQAGRLSRAKAIYLEILTASPSHPDALHLLGLVAYQTENHAEAERLIRQALVLRPGEASFLINLGSALQSQGKVDEAIERFQQAQAKDPSSPTAPANLGNALYARGDLSAAEAAYRQALDKMPRYDGARVNLGNTLVAQGRLAEAAHCYQEVLTHTPQNLLALTNLATALRLLGKPAEAALYVARAVETDPNYAAAFRTMGEVFYDLGSLDDAARAYQRAVALDPSDARGHANLGLVQRLCGLPEAAAASFQQAYARSPNHGLSVRLATLLPVVPASQDQALAYRNRLEEELDRLSAAGVSVGDPAAEVGVTNFYLAYHGLNDRPLQQKLAHFYQQVHPLLSQSESRSRRVAKNSARHRRLRIGFASRYLGNHTIGKLLRGFIEQLDRQRFEVAVFHIGGLEDALSAAIDRAADRASRLRGPLAAVRSEIGAAELDVLCYPEVGIDPQTYFLAFSRLAPVQCAMWGHPVTTGIPALDYFISAECLEPDGAEEHYSERLVRLQRLPAYYYQPCPPDPPAPRQDLAGGIEDAHWYVCPQSLFKLHPTFDAALAAILRRDPRGRLILVEGMSAVWGERLRQRFASTDPVLAERTVFLPRLGERDFLSLLLHADALLDPPHFGGGNTSYEAFAMAAPVVTWPGEFMRGRVTAGCYRQMGIEGCVASDQEEYVELALRLATDAGWRAQLSADITARRGALFEDGLAVQELERFFQTVAGGAERRGSRTDR